MSDDAVLTTVSDTVPEELEVVDFFAFKETKDVNLRDTDQYLTIKRFTEGDRRKYMNATSREVKFAQGGSTSMALRPGDDRRALLETAVVGWNISRAGRPLDFSPRNFTTFLDSVDPTLIDEVEKVIREYNPWLMADVTVEDIDEQITELEELRKTRLMEAEGNDD